MKSLPPILAVVAVLSVTTTASADDASVVEVNKERTNSINASPLGVLIGAYNVNYEKLFGSHGFLIEGSYARASNDDSSSADGGLNVGYRWHWRGKQNSGFLGITAGYSLGTGEATVGDGMSQDSFDVDYRVFAVTGNIGKRWAWDNGLNVTFRVGAGYGNWDVSTDSTDPDAQEATELVDDLLTLLPVALDGELSLGYTF